MDITNFDCRSQIDGAVLIAADYGRTRVLAEIRRVDLDDYFERSCPHMTDTQRVAVVRANEAAIGALIAKKCAMGVWTDEQHIGAKVKRVPISKVDLKSVPPLSDAPLK
jgi:hypothetical protein